MCLQFDNYFASQMSISKTVISTCLNDETLDANVLLLGNTAFIFTSTIQWKTRCVSLQSTEILTHGLTSRRDMG